MTRRRTPHLPGQLQTRLFWEGFISCKKASSAHNPPILPSPPPKETIYNRICMQPVPGALGDCGWRTFNLLTLIHRVHCFVAEDEQRRIHGRGCCSCWLRQVKEHFRRQWKSLFAKTDKSQASKMNRNHPQKRLIYCHKNSARFYKRIYLHVK